MDGLAFTEQGGDKTIKLESLLFGNTNTGTGFRTDSFVFILSRFGRVDMFFQSTAVPFGTAIADIRRL